MKRDRGKIKATREGGKKDYEKEGDERQREKLPKEASKGEPVETVCEIESEDANSGVLKASAAASASTYGHFWSFQIQSRLEEIRANRSYS